jgi:iron complex transport system substrate-binding protein
LRRIGLFLYLCILPLVPAAHGLVWVPPTAATESRSFTDDLTRTVLVPATPSRVISLAPSITEMLFAIGLDREIVAVTPFCDFPAAAAGRPQIGYANPSLEQIVALNPDLVIAPADFLHPTLLGKLEQLRIPTLVLSARSLKDIEQHLRLFGLVFNRPSQAEGVVNAMRQRMEAANARVRKLRPVRVLYVLNSRPLITVGPGSYIHELLERARAVNIAASAGTAYPRIGMDTVVAGDPEILLFPAGKTETVPVADREAWKRWTDMTAVRTGRLHTVSSDVINRPGPRIVEALEELISIVHPAADQSRPSR